MPSIYRVSRNSYLRSPGGIPIYPSPKSSLVLQVFQKDIERYTCLRANEETVHYGDVIKKPLATRANKFLHKRTVAASAAQLKETLDFMDPKFRRFMGALKGGCPVEGCEH